MFGLIPTFYLGVLTPWVLPDIFYREKSSFTIFPTSSQTRKKMDPPDFQIPFPEGKTPFPQQVRLMEKVVQAIQNSEHALLESPTGTGKTLALLCASLAARKSLENPGPPIYYGSRTHSQLRQVVAELRECPLPEGTKMVVLASREHYCLKADVKSSSNVNDACVNAVEEKKCKFFDGNEALARATESDIQDIEDLVRDGLKLSGCPYHASRIRHEGADIVFAPYNYLVDMDIRKALKLDLNGATVIIDEAHNLGDVVRDSCSSVVPLAGITAFADDLRESHRSIVLLKLLDMIRFWVGEQPVLSVDNIHIAQGEKASVSKGGSFISDMENVFEIKLTTTMMHRCEEMLSDNATYAQMVRSLLFSLQCMLSEDSKYANDFYVAVRPSGSGGGQKCTVGLELCVWSMTPAAGFAHIKNAARSVILTSGTLSPLRSFESELDCEFKHQLVETHVCDVKDRLIAVAYERQGQRNLSGTHTSIYAHGYVDALGESLVNAVEPIPEGVLVFFSSYFVMDKCITTWRQSGVLERLGKTFFSEDRNITSGEFQLVVDRYKESCKVRSGAVFFAVFRGKISEGIDFKDESARGVIITGIPFPNFTDTLVILKKKHLDRKRDDSFTGDDWYNQQAYRALNQAIGRVIRHRLDYGVILFLDSRFTHGQSVRQLSKWMRKSVTMYEETSETKTILEDFFKTFK